MHVIREFHIPERRACKVLGQPRSNACLSNAAAIILIHQHPTGDPTPSTEDIAITRRLKEAGEIMGIKILDHIIVGEGEYLSFVERGLL